METIYYDTGSFSSSHERKAVSCFSPNLKILWLHVRRCFNVFCVDIPGKSNTIGTILTHFMTIWTDLDGFRRRETVFGADLDSLLNTLRDLEFGLEFQYSVKIWGLLYNFPPKKKF